MEIDDFLLIFQKYHCLIHFNNIFITSKVPSPTLPLEPKLFHVHGEFQEKLVEPHKSNPPQLI